MNNRLDQFAIIDYKAKLKKRDDKFVVTITDQDGQVLYIISEYDASLCKDKVEKVFKLLSK